MNHKPECHLHTCVDSIRDCLSLTVSQQYKGQTGLDQWLIPEVHHRSDRWLICLDHLCCHLATKCALTKIMFLLLLLSASSSSRVGVKVFNLSLGSPRPFPPCSAVITCLFLFIGLICDLLFHHHLWDHNQLRATMQHVTKRLYYKLRGGFRRHGWGRRALYGEGSSSAEPSRRRWGWIMGREFPLSSRLGDLGERREFPQRDPGRSPGQKRISALSRRHRMPVVEIFVIN